MDMYQQNIDDKFEIADKEIIFSEYLAPLTFYHSHEKYDFLNNSNKILMPKILLNKLSVYDNLNFPLTIKIKDTIIGIHEIIEDIDTIYIPNYICRKLFIFEPKLIDIVFLNYELPKATFVKFKPHQSLFYNVPDTKSFLESNLKKLYTHLEQNQTINIPYLDNILYFDVIEIKPANLCSIIDTELEVDFEKAHDYVEPKPKTKKKFQFKKPEEKKTGFIPFSGKGRKLND